MRGWDEGGRGVVYAYCVVNAVDIFQNHLSS